MNKISNITSKNGYSLELINGLNVNNQPFYAFVLLKNDKLTLLKEKMSNQDVNLNDFGVIIDFGYGQNPSQSAISEAINKSSFGTSNESI